MAYGQPCPRLRAAPSQPPPDAARKIWHQTKIHQLEVSTLSGDGQTKVLTIVEENHSLQQMQTSMPFLSALATQYGYATGYTAVSHPSLPNYLAISGGSTFDITNDAAPAAHPIPGPSVFGQALAAGKTAKVYAESMPTNCALTNTDSYAVRHTGWAYYIDERAALWVPEICAWVLTWRFVIRRAAA